jgi:hypothetical protein
MMGERVGMHMHSHYSDGSDAPYALVEKIVAAGLGGACLTDHDSIDGLVEFQALAKRSNIETISGVEVSAHWENRTFVHILGYGIDYRNKGDLLREGLLKNVDAQRGLFDKIMEGAIEKFSVCFLENDVLRETGQMGSVSFGLPTLRFLEQYLGLKMDEFNKKVFSRTPSFAEAIIDGDFLSVEEAMELIQTAGGKAVLAHPGLFSKYTVRGHSERLDFEELFFDLIDMDLSGIEAFYPDHNLEQTQYFNRLSAMHGLWRTTGTDYHGSYIPEHGLAMDGIGYAEFMAFKEFCER